MSLLHHMGKGMYLVDDGVSIELGSVKKKPMIIQPSPIIGNPSKGGNGLRRP